MPYFCSLQYTKAKQPNKYGWLVAATTVAVVSASAKEFGIMEK